MKWPTQPSLFQSLVAVPEDRSDDGAWYFIVLDGKTLCLSENGVPQPIDADAYRWLDLDIHYEHYMGHLDGRSCFAVHASGRAPEGYALAGLRDWLGRAEPELFYLAGRAAQLVDWHVTHMFCGRCGEATQDHDADRAKVCTACGQVFYPRLSPSIIVLVTRGQEMLLARNAAWPKGMFSTLAGFVEPGESVEQTVHREVREEVGIEVTNLRYLGSQSWPFPNSLMLGFHADYASGDLVLDDVEISEAEWFHYSELPNVPPATAISRWLIDDFVAECEHS